MVADKHLGSRAIRDEVDVDRRVPQRAELEHSPSTETLSNVNVVLRGRRIVLDGHLDLGRIGVEDTVLREDGSVDVTSEIVALVAGDLTGKVGGRVVGSLKSRRGPTIFRGTVVLASDGKRAALVV